MRRYFLILLIIAVVLLAGATPSVVATVSQLRSFENKPSHVQNSGPDRNNPIAGTPVQDMRGSDQIDPLTFYESPTFGYVIPWFEDIWHVETSESGPDGDRWVLSREGDVVTFHGYEGDAGDPVACLSRAIDQLEQTMEVVLETHVDFDENPMEGGDQRLYAWGAYVVAPSGDVDGEQQDSVWYLECRRLVPGSAVLAITLEMSRARFDNLSLTEEAYTFIDSVVMPRIAFDLEEMDGQPVLVGPLLDPNPNPDAYDWYFPRNPRLLFDSSGAEAGMATIVTRYDPNRGVWEWQGAWHLFVLFENTSDDRDLPIDPLAIVVTAVSQLGENEFEEDILRPTAYHWETGEGDLAAQEQVIEPGERMMVRLTIAERPFDGTPPGQLYYLVMYDNEDTRLGEWRDSEGAGGRPRLGG